MELLGYLKAKNEKELLSSIVELQMNSIKRCLTSIIMVLGFLRIEKMRQNGLSLGNPVLLPPSITIPRLAKRSYS